MLIFALIGNSELVRNQVFDQFARHIGAAGVLFSMPPGMTEPDRLALLRRQFNPARAISRELLLNGLHSVPEFDWVRSVGGYVVHVDGRPSDVVAMKPRDFFVTPNAEGRGRFDGVEDCYAAIKLRYRQDAERRLMAKERA